MYTHTLATRPKPSRRKHNYVHWVAQKVDGAYADAHMRFVIMETSDDEEATLEGEEGHADELLGACNAGRIGTFSDRRGGHVTRRTRRQASARLIDNRLVASRVSRGRTIHNDRPSEWIGGCGDRVRLS